MKISEVVLHLEIQERDGLVVAGSGKQFSGRGCRRCVAGRGGGGGGGQGRGAAAGSHRGNRTRQRLERQLHFPRTGPLTD